MWSRHLCLIDAVHVHHEDNITGAENVERAVYIILGLFLWSRFKND